MRKLDGRHRKMMILGWPCFLFCFLAFVLDHVCFYLQMQRRIWRLQANAYILWPFQKWGVWPVLSFPLLEESLKRCYNVVGFNFVYIYASTQMQLMSYIVLLYIYAHKKNTYRRQAMCSWKHIVHVTRFLWDGRANPCFAETLHW